MKKIIYLLFLTVLITSCSTTFTDQSKLERKDGKFTLNGEVFNGVALKITSKNKVQYQNTYTDGNPIRMTQYSIKEGQFEEVELSDGLTTFISDIILTDFTLKKRTDYYTNGSIKRKIEVLCQGSIQNCENNGIYEEYDKLGNVTKLRYFENGKIKKQ